VAFSLRIGPAVAFFLALAAADHLLVASPGVHGWYERGLARRAGYARWIEYSISASAMIVLIGVFAGVRDLAAVIAVFAANTAMILFGLLMERQQRPGAADWSAFWFGSLAGIVPWALIAVYIAQPTGGPAGASLAPTCPPGRMASPGLITAQPAARTSRSLAADPDARYPEEVIAGSPGSPGPAS
jgi:heliorhodopsin